MGSNEKNPQNSQKNERISSFENLIKVSCQNPPAHARHIFLIKKDLLNFQAVFPPFIYLPQSIDKTHTGPYISILFDEINS